MKKNLFDLNSFKFEIAITLKCGETLRFGSSAANPSFGPSDYFNGKAHVYLSPKELGSCKDIDVFIQRLCEGVFDDECPLFSTTCPFKDNKGTVHDPNMFIENVRNKVGSINNIAFIEVIGEAYHDDGRGGGFNSDNYYLQYYRYDMLTGRFEGIVYGEPRDVDYTVGELNICTTGCWIRHVRRPQDFLNCIEGLPNDDEVRVVGNTAVDVRRYDEVFAGNLVNSVTADGEWENRVIRPKWIKFGESEEEYEYDEETLKERIKRLEEERMENFYQKLWELVDSGITIEEYVSLLNSGIFEEDGIEINELFGDYEEDDEDGIEINDLFADREEDEVGADINELFEEIAYWYEWDGTYSYELPDDEDGVEINKLLADCEDDGEDGISLNAIFEALDIPTYEPLFKLGVPVI